MIAALFIQLIHYSYFGTRISAIDISLFFSNSLETLQIFSQLSRIALLPLIICSAAFLVIYFFSKKLNVRKKWCYAWLLVLIFLLTPVYKILLAIKDQGRHMHSNATIGDFANTNDNLWISTQKTILYYFTYMLPQKLFSDNHLAQPILPPLTVGQAHPNLNIILIMGESLTYTHMSSYGYPRPTTPYLDSLKNHANIIFKLGVSAGVSTSISLPMFFNMAFRPDASIQVTSGQRNVFKMAKANGFTTHFVSTQARYILGGVKNYLFSKYIDNYADSSYFGAAYRQSVYDSKLVTYLELVDFKNPSFIVLHQRGSHAAYYERYPHEFTFFKSKNHPDFITEQIDTYDNSVRYTDKIIADLVNLIRQKTHRPTVVVFTSDHGESLGEKGVYGHNNLQMEGQHFVPIVFIALNGANLNFLQQKTREDLNSNYMSHYELSETVGYLLGYRIPDFSQQKVGYFVNGSDLTGAAGFNQISFDKNGKLIDHFQY